MSDNFKVHIPGGKAAARPNGSAPATSGKPADPKAEAVKAAAERAKAEAEARRKAAEDAARKERELGGPEGPEPTRYGDWEKKGICYDF